jgi:hypothetical protein
MKHSPKASAEDIKKEINQFRDAHVNKIRRKTLSSKG